MTKDFLEEKKREQAAILKEYRASLFDNAKDIGYSKKNDEWFDYLIKPQDSAKNLYKGIRKEAIEYFKKYGIVWWQCLNKSYEPTGHMVSSQIHCLNHLFAFRDKPEALKLILQKATLLPIKSILPSPIDKDGYIAFEFVYKNRTLLHEKNETRGANCTSIDALVFVETEENKSVLVPIEWKYTESYDKKKKADEDVVNERYKDLASRPYSNLNGWIDEYYYDPLYEFARQTLLMEQIIHANPFGLFPVKADDYKHIIVRPNDNKEICTDIQNFKKDLKNKDKVIEIDPQDLLSPMRDNMKYEDLINYLQTRYWE